MDEINYQMDRPAGVLKAIKFGLMSSRDMVSFYSALADFKRETRKYVKPACISRKG
jgi:hypothetical protein